MLHFENPNAVSVCVALHIRLGVHLQRHWQPRHGVEILPRGTQLQVGGGGGGFALAFAFGVCPVGGRVTEPGKQHGFILGQGGAGDGGYHHGGAAAAAVFEREVEMGVCVREVQLQLRR